MRTIDNSKFKEENEVIKELFNFNGDETQFKRLQEDFSNFIKNSQNDLRYFIDLLDFTLYVDQINGMFPKNLLIAFVLILNKSINITKM